MTVTLPLGAAPRPEGGPPDFERLRAARRRRLFEGMEEEGIDVLALGRPASTAYATGSRMLWTAGTRPYGPVCVAVGATGRLHLVSTWDEGVPDEIARDELIGLSWNPAIAMSRLQEIPGLARARRVGTDGWGPETEQMAAVLFPAAELVDANPLLARIRVPKTVDEVACIATAAAIAESALTAMIAALTPGVTERQLVGVYAERIASLGSPPPPTEGVACLAAALHRVPSDRRAEPGQLAALSPSAFFGGYEGGLARTWTVGRRSPTSDQMELLARGRAALDAVTKACVPGATGAEIAGAWDATGETAPPEPLVRGLGLGTETPVIGAGLGRRESIQEGMVLGVQAWVAEAGAGGVLEADTVLVTANGPIALTRYGRPDSSRNRA